MKRTPHGVLHELPSPPDSITSEAKEIYSRCGSFLVSKELLTSGDVFSLIAFAVSLSRAFALDRHVEANGLLLPDGKRNPCVGAAQQAHAVAKAWAVALALVPVSRRALPAGPATTPYDDGEPSALAALLAQQPIGRRFSSR